MQKNKKITIVAHRGCNYSGCIENTIPAFLKAIQDGAPVIEFDVQRTTDRGIFIFHDLYLEQKTTGAGKFSKQTTAYIESLFLIEKDKNLEKIPQLKQLLDIIADIQPSKRPMLNIEIKTLKTGKYVAKLLKKYIKANRLLVSDFLISSVISKELSNVRKRLPNIQISLLNSILSMKKVLYEIASFKTHVSNRTFIKNIIFLKNIIFTILENEHLRIKFYESIKIIIFGKRLYYEQLFSFGKSINASGIHFWYGSISMWAIRKAHENGFFVWVYTINEREYIQKMIKKGIDGFFTDYYKEAAKFVDNNK